MPVRPEHRWQRQRRQYRFVMPVEPTEVMLQNAWERSGMKTPFQEAMDNPTLARLIRMMAVQGHKKNEAVGGEAL
ncbi:hypothetical protein [Endozoicomonas sp. ALD040]|uniref:hypothetical protein n=1 Tax=Endozoicomonas sp. ALD040 TaxID=3403079 RepID=UPI003BB12FD0